MVSAFIILGLVLAVFVGIAVYCHDVAEALEQVERDNDTGYRR